MLCNVCQFENLPDLPRCGRCGSLLIIGDIEIEPPRASALRLTNRATRVYYGFAAWLARLSAAWSAWTRQTEDPTDIPALLLTLVPGLGHFYRRQRVFAALYFGTWLTLLAATTIAAGSTEATLCWNAAVGVHGAAFMSLVAGRLPSDGRVARFGVALATFLLVYLVIYAPGLWTVARFVQLMTIRNIPPAALIHNGDMLWVDGPWIRPERFAVGDVVAYRIAGFIGPHSRVDGLNVDRIVGAPGDLVHLRADGWYLNGAPAAPGGVPLAVTHVDGAEWRLKPNEYLIYPSTLPGATDSLAVVKEEAIVGRVRWRVRPWSQAGPLR